MVAAAGAPWWRDALIYQVYPRSFLDTDGDGVGDLRGIRDRLDYLSWLGIDTLWVSPIFRSPMADFGYDVEDYLSVDPVFGTLGDVDALLGEVHRRRMRLLLDFVPNHTSDRHPWFLESRGSRDNPKRDWYIWRDAAPGGGPPNNWLSHFGGSAWEWHEATGQYYYHAFLAAQPDLNWRHPEVRRAMADVLRFWLDRGVDGFRVDVIWHLIKDDEFRDNPPNPAFLDGMTPYRRLLPAHSADRPEVHDVIASLRAVLAEYSGRILLGETYLPFDRLAAYYGDPALPPHLPFNFSLIQCAWNARDLALAILDYEQALPDHGWPVWALGNHDKPRLATRLGARQARVAAMLLLTLRGTPTLYYGDELGMPDGVIPPQAQVDPKGRNLPGFGRDGARTPMQWGPGRHDGFTTGAPWLPVASTDPALTVAVQQDDPVSTLALYRALIQLRREEPCLGHGRYGSVTAQGGVLAYTREQAGQVLFVLLNLTPHPATCEFASLSGRVRLSTHLDRRGEAVEGQVELRGDEGLVIAGASVCATVQSAATEDVGRRT